MSLMGIICASDTERDPFLKWMKQVSKTKAAVLEFYQGTLSGVPVVVVYSGVCKVSAAIAAQLLITMFHVDGIINSGTAGGGGWMKKSGFSTRLWGNMLRIIMSRTTV